MDAPTPGDIAGWPCWLIATTGHGTLPLPPSVSPAQWDSVVDAARRHQVAPLLYWRMRHCAADAVLPANILGQLHDQYMAAAALALVRERELRQVLGALCSAGIVPTLYKGAALAHTVYPTPACRPMGDLDLWVDEPLMSEAIRALEMVGYTLTSKSLRPAALQRLSHGEIQMTGRGEGRGLVELHWGVFGGQWLLRATAVDHESVARRRIRGEVLGHEALLLAPEDTIIHLTVHLAVNHQMSLPLRSLVDIALVSHKGVDWAAVAERADAWRVATPVGTVLRLASAVFGPENLPAGMHEAAARLRGPAVTRVIAGRWASPGLFLNGMTLSKSRRRYLWLLAMADRPSDRLRLVGRALWPESEWLEARYGQASPAIRCRHLAGAVRGRL